MSWLDGLSCGVSKILAIGAARPGLRFVRVWRLPVPAWGLNSGVWILGFGAACASLRSWPQGLDVRLCGCLV